MEDFGAVLQIPIVHMAPFLHNASASIQTYKLGVMAAVNRLQKGFGSIETISTTSRVVCETGNASGSGDLKR